MTALGRPGTPRFREKWLAMLIDGIDMGYLPDGTQGVELMVTAYAFAAAANIAGQNALMSVPMLMRRTRLSRRRAVRARDLLIDYALSLEVQEAGHGNRHGKGKATVYRLVIPTSTTLAPVYREHETSSETSTGVSAEAVDVETSTGPSAEVVDVETSNVNHFSSNVDHDKREPGRPSVLFSEKELPVSAETGAAAPLMTDEHIDDDGPIKPRPPW